MEREARERDAGWPRQDRGQPFVVARRGPAPTHLDPPPRRRPPSRGRAGAARAGLAAGCVVLLVGLAVAGYVGRGQPAQLAFGPSAQAGAGAATFTPLPPIGGIWLAPIPSDAPPAPSSTDPARYVREYGFDPPDMRGAGLSPSEVQRLAVMLPYAVAAAARWNARYGSQLEPQLLLFWTHAEGIDGRVTYSNCANERPPGGLSLFQYIANCDTPSFWQLGYGNQFSRITILKTAFMDMRGDPDDARLVQRIGQAVLDWDRRQGTTPKCGGYACTFPTLTIDQILLGVSLDHAAQANWWASVLSRDPAINAYMLARTLAFFNHAETKDWVGCYYAEPCWQGESNSLGDVLASWPALLRAAHLA